LLSIAKSAISLSAQAHFELSMFAMVERKRSLAAMFQRFGGVAK
jgi:hypothetical protein